VVISASIPYLPVRFVVVMILSIGLESLAISDRLRISMKEDKLKKVNEYIAND